MFIIDMLKRKKKLTCIVGVKFIQQVEKKLGSTTILLFLLIVDIIRFIFTLII